MNKLAFYSGYMAKYAGPIAANNSVASATGTTTTTGATANPTAVTQDTGAVDKMTAWRNADPENEKAYQLMMTEQGKAMAIPQLNPAATSKFVSNFNLGRQTGV